MPCTITIPSKTFIAGEYNVLTGGYAIVVNNAPCFKINLNTNENSNSTTTLFHQKSPAARFIENNKKKFTGYDISFYDPHQSRGGFGASGAQFLGVYLLREYLQNGQDKITFNNHGALLEEFWSYYPDQTKTKPSGADLISQLSGGIAMLNTKTPTVVSKQWGFSNIKFYIIPTNYKTNTHTYLENLKLTHNQEIDNIVKQIASDIGSSDSDSFINNLRTFKNHQEQSNLVIDNSLQQIKRLEEHKAVILAKGCGALGADVLLVIIHKELDQEFKSWSKNNSINLIASNENISSGASIQITNKVNI